MPLLVANPPKTDILLTRSKERILHECSFLNQFIKKVREKGSTVRFVKHSIAFHLKFNKFNSIEV